MESQKKCKTQSQSCAGPITYIAVKILKAAPTSRNHACRLVADATGVEVNSLRGWEFSDRSPALIYVLQIAERLRKRVDIIARAWQK